MLLFAQEVAPVPVWFQICVQLGAFGLLVVVVCIQAPRYFRETREERQQMAVQHDEFVKYLQEKFEERTNLITAALDKNSKAIDDQSKAINSQSDSWIEEIRRHTDAIKGFAQNLCRYQPK